MFSLMGKPLQTSLPIKECEHCGRSFVPHNYAQEICGKRGCFLDWFNKKHTLDPHFGTRPRIPLGGE